MKHFVVAIGREFGAQGCDIAEKLAEKLGVKLYDRQLVEEAAKKLEMDEHTVQKADEVSAKDIEGLKLHTASAIFISQPRCLMHRLI